MLAHLKRYKFGASDGNFNIKRSDDDHWKPVDTIAQSHGRGEWGHRGALWRWWWRPPAGPCRSFLKQCCLQFYWEFQTVVNVFQWSHLDHSQVGGSRSVGWWVVGYQVVVRVVPVQLATSPSTTLPPLRPPSSVFFLLKIFVVTKYTDTKKSGFNNVNKTFEEETWPN